MREPQDDPDFERKLHPQIEPDIRPEWERVYELEEREHPKTHKLTPNDTRRAQVEMAEGHAVYVRSVGAYRQLLESSGVDLDHRFVGDGTMIAVREADE